MAEVISASELRPSTMYQYFSNKDDIVWAILSEVLEESAARAKKMCRGRNERARQDHRAAAVHGR